jgi:soluble lytic murein transglycosylase
MRGRNGIFVICLLILLIPPAAAAPPQVEPESAWRVALERIGAKDYQGAAPLLAELSHRNAFQKVNEAGFLLGVSLYRQQRWREALDVLEPAAAQLPALADYALYYAASAYQALGLKPQALAAFSRLIQEHPGSLLTERAQRERAMLYADANLLFQAEEAYRDYLSRATDAARRREAMLALAEITLRVGKRREAEDLLRQLWLQWPGSREAVRAGEILISMAEAQPFTLDEEFERALTLYRGGQYVQAAAAFSPFLTGGSPYASRARLLSGISHFQLRDYGRAIVLLSSLIREPSPVRAEALYWIGRSYGRLDDREKAIKSWVRLAHNYPRSPWADGSLYLMALNYREDGKPERAVAALSRLLRDHPSSRWADAALWTRAWINYRRSALTQALHDLQRLQTNAAPTSRFRVQALYWQGRILEHLTKRGEAIDAYRTLLKTFGDEYYYAEQTRLRLNHLDPSAGRAITAASPRMANLEPREPLPSLNAPQAAKARLLKGLNLREEASEEFWALTGRYVEDRQLLHEACSAFLDMGYIEKSVWIAKRLLRPLYPQSRPAEPVPRYWEFLYPLGYWELVKEKSAHYTLDPYLVVALIREESGFGERVVSSAGAVGLMQLLPKTVDQMVKASGESRGFPNLDSPAANIGLGTRYLAKMLEEFKGNWAMALAAYNAGPHQVRRWLELWGYRTDDEFIEEIPFSETQQYVKRVLGSYYRYRAQYAAVEQVAGSGAG